MGALIYAADKLKADKAVVLAAVTSRGYAVFQYAASNLRENKDLWMAAVQKDGNALEFAADAVRRDKEIVVAAVQKHGHAIKFALDGLNQDQGRLKAADSFDTGETKDSDRSEKAPPQMMPSTGFCCPTIRTSEVVHPFKNKVLANI